MWKKGLRDGMGFYFWTLFIQQSSLAVFIVRPTTLALEVQESSYKRSQRPPMSHRCENHSQDITSCSCLGVLGAWSLPTNRASLNSTPVIFSEYMRLTCPRTPARAAPVVERHAVNAKNCEIMDSDLDSTLLLLRG